MTYLIGQSLGRYHILEQLGEGGMAIVYKAYDTRLERHVAVKVIRRDAIRPGNYERFIKRFEREAKALAQLSHPNIVKVLDYGEQEGLPYLVMEYLPGGTLKQQISSRMAPGLSARAGWQKAAGMLAPIARALQYAHGQKIVHRDVKPANILLTQSGEPMLSDFGIAKLLEAEETIELTGTGVSVGTPEYMAPEQGLGKAVDHRADIYALGVVFYEMVTGRKPYQADTPMAIMLKKATEPFPRPTQFVRNLPESIERVMIKALARDLRNRYQDAGALALAFEKIAQGIEPGSEEDQARSGKQGFVKWLPWLAGGAAILCLGMIVITGIILGRGLLVGWRGGGEASPTSEMSLPNAQAAATTSAPGGTMIPANTSAPTKTSAPKKTITPTFEAYRPISNCAASRLHVGDSAYIDFNEGRNAIRSSPDTHPSDNKIGFAEVGEVLWLVGGPECNYGWLLWEVRTIYGVQGWTPETDGSKFFLVPIATWQACPDAPQSRLHVGDEALVGSDPQTANRVRQQASSDSTKVGTINPDEHVEIIGGPQCNQGLVWWEIRSLSSGLTGWTAEGDASSYWLVPLIPHP